MVAKGATCRKKRKRIRDMSRTAVKITLNATEQELLRKIHNKRSVPEFMKRRIQAVLSESLVLSVCRMLGINRDLLGVKEKFGILKSMASRKAFLEDESHRIRFAYTPKHCPWLNQIEVWFSGLSRRVLRRGSFTSVDILNTRILSYIDY